MSRNYITISCQLPGQFTRYKEMKSVNNHHLCTESHSIFCIIHERMLKYSRPYRIEKRTNQTNKHQMFSKIVSWFWADFSIDIVDKASFFLKLLIFNITHFYINNLYLSLPILQFQDKCNNLKYISFLDRNYAQDPRLLHYQSCQRQQLQGKTKRYNFMPFYKVLRQRDFSEA